jgi:Domain of unknown function(DUF2779)
MSRSKSSGLSKSLILKGLQCHKALWLAKNSPDFTFPPQPDLQAKLQFGTDVGILAQQLFSGGIEVPYEGLSFSTQLVRTKQLIDNGAEVIYEASFLFSAIFVKVDILVRDGDAWKIYEVKMGTGVKPVNFDDVAIQQYVLTGCGLSVSKSFLIHIDNNYVRQGELELNKLFSIVDISSEVMARQQRMPEIVSELRSSIQQKDEPSIDIGPYCTEPYECDFIPYCWRHIPDNSIFDLKGRGIKKFDYYNKGIVNLKDLPQEKLNPAQRQQVKATLNQQDSVNPQGVKAFLNTLWYPLCHLDFETFNTPLPKFDNTRPYQQVPFQYSLHIQQSAGEVPQHFEYLAQSDVDPRRELVEQLLTIIPKDACILTYNQAFEIGVLRHLADIFPDLNEAVNLCVANVRDLMLPFRKRDVYYWSMHGSYSIKKVLPSLVPDLSYEGMQVADGMAAMRAYHRMCELEPSLELDSLRHAMLQYCGLDTFAMVRILDALYKLVDLK